MPFRAVAARFGRRVTLAHELLVVAGLVIAAALIVAVLAFSRASDQTQASCTAALRVRDAMVSILVDGQRRTARTPAETLREEQRRDALEFYDRSIARLRAVHCDR